MTFVYKLIDLVNLRKIKKAVGPDISFINMENLILIPVYGFSSSEPMLDFSD